MTDLFISYSRKDIDFARVLTSELKRHGQGAWIDWQDIPRGADWLAEIHQSIENADAIVFIVTQHSLTSEICNHELEHARRYNKRILPVIRQRIEGDVQFIVKGIWWEQPWHNLALGNWAALGKSNWIFFDPPADFDAAFKKLLDAAAADPDHIRQHTRLLQLALDWERNDYAESYLLVSAGIVNAEKWLAEAENLNPPPTDLHRAYVDASRKADDVRRAVLEQAEKRIESLNLASYAIEILNENGGNAETAALLAIRALKITFTPQADAALMYAIKRLYTQNERDIYFNHIDRVNSAVFSLDGQFVLTTSDDHIARLWDAQSGQEIRQYIGHIDRVNSAVFSPDEQFVLTASGDDTARLWNAQSGQEIRRFSGHTTWVSTAVFSPDGQFILTASHDHIARLWNAQSGQEIRQYIGHIDVVNSAVFSLDGQFILTASHDHIARLWNAQSGQEIRQYIGHIDRVNSAVFSPDGRFILTSGSDTARLWNAQSGQEIRRFTGQGGTSSAVFSPDGRFILTASYDNTARLWDAQSGQEIRRFSGLSYGVNSAVFSPDGRFILTAGWDGTARIWDTDYRDFIDYACTRVFRDLTDEERRRYGIPADSPTCDHFGPKNP